MTRRTRSRHAYRIAFAACFLLAAGLAACDSGGVEDSTTVPPTSAPTTTTSSSSSVAPAPSTTTTSITTTTLGPLAVDSVAEYLIVVLRASRAANVATATSQITTSPSPEGYEQVLAALEAQLAEVTRVIPPAQAEDFHSALIRQLEDGVSLYRELVEAIGDRDLDRLNVLAQEALVQAAGALEIAGLQQELLESALEGRSDPAASYVLAAGGLSAELGEDVQGLVDRVVELASGEEDFEMLLALVEEQSETLLAVANDWRRLHPPQAAATYHAGQVYVAAGMGGALQRAADAIRDEDFETLTEAFQAIFGLVGVLPESAVAFEDATIAVLEGDDGSSDGPITWAAVPIVDDFGFGTAHDVVVFEDGLYMVGSYGVLASTDGIAWSRVLDFPVFDGFQSMSAIEVVGSELVAVGAAQGPESLDTAVWRSSDGVNWIRTAQEGLASPGRQEMRSIASVDGTHVAVGLDGELESAVAAVWVSSDLDHWERIPIGESDSVSMRHVIGGEGRFIAVGSSIAVSDDGRSWTTIDVGDDVQLGRAIRVGSGYLAVGTRGLDDEREGVVLASTDGVQWVESVSSDLGGPGPQVVVEVLETPDGLLAVGVDDATVALWTSDDGATWSRVAFTEASDPFADPGLPIAATTGGAGVVIIGIGSVGVSAPGVWIGFIDS